MIKQKTTPSYISRPPIVTVMGHVDHGKTTLLDTIRKTNIANQEYGSITQHIGAYQVTVTPKGEQSSRATPSSLSKGSRGIQPDKGILRQAQDDFVSSGHKITFIDTPGHEAFSKMRSRGANVADIVVLVVAANDGVLPQTIESIAHIKAAKIPCIVGLNKMDLPDLLPDKIKKQLTKAGLTLEENGGETPVVPISAKTGAGIDKLLETILLLADLFQVKEVDHKKFSAVVIESSLSQSKGPVATTIVRSGTIQIGQEVVCDNQSFRVRALLDFRGKNILIASASEPVEVLGWKILPEVGNMVYSKEQVALAVKDKSPLSKERKTQALAATAHRELTEEKIKLIIKSDTAGTLEAITSSLKNNLEIISGAVGTISESDILLAKTTGAIVVGFHLSPSSNIVKLAQSEKVIIKTYNLIYELFKEIDEVAEALKHGNLVEVLGEAKIVALFPYESDLVAGIKVTSGRIARGDQVKVMRVDKEIGRSRIKSLRERKKDINRAELGMEAGVILSQKIDFLTGDSIISIG